VVAASAKKDAANPKEPIMKLTKEKLRQIIKEEYDSMYSADSGFHADRILEDKLDNAIEQIKSGMYKMRDEGAEAELIDAYEDLEEVLIYIKEVLGK
jgi:hypothetical protein